MFTDNAQLDNYHMTKDIVVEPRKINNSLIKYLSRSTVILFIGDILLIIKYVEK